MDTKNTPDNGPQTPESSNAVLTVRQPDKMSDLLDTVNLLSTVTERIGENASENWSGSGNAGDDDGTGAKQGSGQSARALAIANLPAEAALRSAMTKHIAKEVKTLRSEVRKLSRQTGKPGGAYKLNKLYARIRRLNAMLSELMEASVDIVKRLYIRVFIDRQSVM